MYISTCKVHNVIINIHVDYMQIIIFNQEKLPLVPVKLMQLLCIQSQVIQKDPYKHLQLTLWQAQHRTETKMEEGKIVPSYQMFTKVHNFIRKVSFTEN